MRCEFPYNPGAMMQLELDSHQHAYLEGIKPSYGQLPATRSHHSPAINTRPAENVDHTRAWGTLDRSLPHSITEANTLVLSAARPAVPRTGNMAVDEAALDDANTVPPSMHSRQVPMPRRKAVREATARSNEELSGAAEVVVQNTQRQAATAVSASIQTELPQTTAAMRVRWARAPTVRRSSLSPIIRVSALPDFLTVPFTVDLAANT
jgi:hypothetical protein